MVIGNNMIRKAACVICALLLLLAGTGSCPAYADTPEDTDTGPQRILHGPLTLPDGMDYSEWKGINYLPDTVFSVGISWYLYNGSEKAPLTDEQLAARDYRLEPEFPNTRLVIASAEAEPVGGEMKLRSGGYVNITITAEGYTDFCYSLNPSVRTVDKWYLGDMVYGFHYTTPVMYPFDLHTGISLLNFFKAADAEDISPFEAADSGFVESRVTWKNRNYRILSREDVRNLGSSNWNRSTEGDRTVVRIENVRTELVYSFRVPADYDGLALCIPKRWVDNDREEKLAEAQGSKPAEVRELYADILTGMNGSTLDPNDFYFIRVSDLLEHFSSKPQE